MATRDFPSSPQDRDIPAKLGIINMFRLGLFQMGLGIMSLLTLGLLNRVMIDELKIPALIAAGAIAMHQIVAPARLWFGQMSDAKPLWGHHRTGYIWIGGGLFTLMAFLAVQVVWGLNASLNADGDWTTATYLWTGLLGVVFALYGLALSASSTPFAALLVDVSDENERPKLVGIVWSMLMVGIVVGAILGGQILDQPQLCGAAILSYDPSQTGSTVELANLKQAVNSVFLFAPAIVFGLCLASTWGIEPKYSRYKTRSIAANREDQITLGRALKVLTASRQTGIFFSFLIMMTISLFMQEAVMEPYGGEVFNMCVSETTQLNAFWGMGTLVGLSATGFLVVPRIGKRKTAKWGCLMAAGCFVLIILSGFTQNPQSLQVALLLFGLAAGMTTSGGISLMLDLTAAETAGVFIGAWGLAQAIARAIATFSGGAILDIGRSLFPNLVFAYGLVFALQAIGMIIAVQLLDRVDVKEFQVNSKQAIAAVLESDLD
ncbi:MAG: BCD family MFS transporter [Leptolyngbyaceae cyanobacterium MO_188.B28]|nr:BCD family MFS transporter [Leptolyngbyaceae cyanobacterium MO_188.B28]